MGFFGDIFGTIKIAKQVTKETLKLKNALEEYQKNDKVTAEDLAENINKLIENTRKIVNSSNISADIKSSFINSFLGGIFSQTRDELSKAGLSATGNDVKELLGWDQATYNKALRASIKN